MKQTEHSRKSEAQNLCSKCPPFTRTHAFKQLRQCAIADGFGDSVQSWCYAAALLGTRVKVNGEYYRNTVLLNMLMLDIRSVFWNYYVFKKMVHEHIVHVIRALSPCCRERRQSLSLQRCGHLIRQIWIRWTTASETARGFAFLRILVFCSGWLDRASRISCFFVWWQLG